MTGRHFYLGGRLLPIFLILLVIMSFTAVGADTNPDTFEQDITKNTQISSKFLDSFDEIPSSRTPFHSSSRNQTDTVRTKVVIRTDNISQTLQLIDLHRGTTQTVYENLVQAQVPHSEIESLAKNDSVKYIRPPLTPSYSRVVSEGVQAINADKAHDLGYTGENTTVAIIDTAFNITNPEINQSITEYRDFTGTGINVGDTQHGTATSEVVVDVAPNASIIPVKVSTSVELLNAVDWIQKNTSADVVSMSLVWPNAGPLDGSSRIDQRIESSVSNGTVWMVSTGNTAGGHHWNGTWSDTDNDGWMNFKDGDELMGVSSPKTETNFELYMSWNDWRYSNNDYDLYLYNSTSNFPEDSVTSSTNPQSGSFPPVESILGRVSGKYYLAIHKHDAQSAHSFDIFTSERQTLEHWTNSRSVMIPAEGRNITGIGAVDWYDKSLEGFSSRGPTIDGRIKPDLVAPDNVTTTAYDRPFYGTSAAAPQAAGAAAVLLQKEPSSTPYETVRTLKDTADSVTSEEPNNKSGWGIIDLAEAVRDEPVLGMSLQPNISPLGETSELSVSLFYKRNHTPVENATLRIEGGGINFTSTTSREGVYSSNINASSTGNITVRASKNGTKPVNGSVHVPEADVVLNNQTLSNRSLIVETSNYTGGSYYVILKNNSGSVIGNSTKLPRGISENVSVDLNRYVTYNQNIIATLHHSTSSGVGDNITQYYQTVRDTGFVTVYNSTYDKDGDGIEIEELRIAIDDYLRDRIPISKLRNVIDSYLKS